MNAHVFQRKSGVPVTDDVQAEIVRMYQAGVMRKQIRDTFNCGNSTITSALIKHGVPLRLSGTMTEKEAEVVRLYLADAVRKDIVDRTGVPNSTITHILRRHGVDRTHKRKSAVPDEIIAQVKRLWGEGKSNREIGRALEITVGSVAGIIHRSGIRRDETVNIANIRRAAQARAPKAKADPKAPPPKLVAVASKDNERVLMVPEEDAHKYESREEAPAVVTSANDPVLKLRALDCRWPIGEVNEQGFHFCCAKRSGSGPYCEEHTIDATSGKTMSTKEFIRSLRRWAA